MRISDWSSDVCSSDLLMTAAGGLVLFAGVNPYGRAWAAPKLVGYPFTLGVASGDPWPDGFVIWTRLAPRPLEEHGGMPMAAIPVRWEVSEDERFAKVRSEEHTSELQSLMRNSYAACCLKK